MRGVHWTGLAAASAAVIAASSAVAWAPAQSRYTEAGPAACKQFESGEPEGQDWVLYRCVGQPGLPVWVLYQDSTRMQMAFGPNNFDHFAPFSAERDERWGLEWRGQQGKVFKAYAVIARMRPVGEQASTLAVYRVWPNMPSCLIGQATTNEQARQIADRAASLAACPS